MEQEEAQQGETGTAAWIPEHYLRKVDQMEAKLSRGLLRSRPEKWFPGLAAHWLPLSHSLGISLKVSEVKPLYAFPGYSKNRFVCSVDDEPMLIVIDEMSAGAILDAVSPGAVRASRGIVLEYMVRRLISSLAACWSGPESSVVRFETEIDPESVRGVASIKLAVQLNSEQCEIWLVIGKSLAERLDGLWRRQMRSAQKSQSGRQEVRLELAELAVPPTMVADYLNTGSTIDLEVPLSDRLTLYLGGKAWLQARMVDLGGRLGIEVLPGQVSSLVLPEGTTRISIEMGTMVLDAAEVSELSQAGTFCDTGLELSDRINMVINGQKVAEATLCTFQGHFAITVG